LDRVGRLARRAAGKPAPFVYTGVQIVSRRLFRDAPSGAFSMNVLWNRAIAEGRVYGLVHEGLWFDVGTPPAIAKTEALLATG
jgi:MurNAc alpha-1-phosphate uridylyltransferase